MSAAPTITAEVIANEALRYLQLSARTLTDLSTDTSPEGKLANQLYGRVVVDALSTHDWNFASRWARLVRYDDGAAVVNLLSSPDDFTDSTVWLREGDTVPTVELANAPVALPFTDEFVGDSMTFADFNGLTTASRLRQVLADATLAEGGLYYLSVYAKVRDGGGTASMQLSCGNSLAAVSLLDNGTVQRMSNLFTFTGAQNVSIRHLTDGGGGVDRDILLAGAMLTEGSTLWTYPAAANKGWSALGDWSYQYRAPTDILIGRGFLTGLRERQPLPVEWELTEQDGIGVVMADVEVDNAFFRYTADVSDTPSRFPSWFVTYVALMLAERMAGPLVNDGGVLEQVMAQRDRARAQAVLIDAQNEQPPEQPVNDFLRARDGYPALGPRGRQTSSSYLSGLTFGST